MNEHVKERLTRRVPGFRKKFSALNYLPALIATLAVLFVTIYADMQRTRITEGIRHDNVTRRLGTVRSRLESNVKSNIGMVEALGDVIGVTPDIDDVHLRNLVKRLAGQTSNVREIRIARDLKVSLVYPSAGNERALGVDLTKDLAMRGAVERAISSRGVIVTGPLTMPDGSKEMLTLYPVFTGENPATQQLWGVVTAAVDLDRLYQNSGLSQHDASIDFAVVRHIPGSGTEMPFFGDPGVLAATPIQMTINLGFENWQISATPKIGWSTDKQMQWAFRGALAIFAAFVIIPMLAVGKLLADRQAHIDMLQKRGYELKKVSQRLEIALDTSKIGVWESDLTSDALIWDERMWNLFGMTRTSTPLTHQDWQDAVHTEDLDATNAAFFEAAEGESEFSAGFRIVLPNGQIRHIRALGTVFRNSAGRKMMVGVNWDVTSDIVLQNQLRAANQQAEEQNVRLEDARSQMEHAALHDALTGLPNRRFLDQILHERADLNGVTVLHIDIDRFKETNDTFGHAAGDHLLRWTTETILGLVYQGDFVARIGSDEFVVVSGEGNSGNDYFGLAGLMVQEIACPILFGGHQYHAGASIGMATGRKQCNPPGELLISADHALYEAKRKGGNRVEIFTQELRDIAVNKRKTADEILVGLEQDQFIAYYQPQFDAKTLEICGAEALVRWDHPTKGILPPVTFLEIAESLRVVASIDASVLNQTHVQLMRLAAAGIDIPKLSVNISAQRLRDPALFEHLDSMAFPLGKLSFELLETISFDDEDNDLMKPMQRLKDMGIDIEIDDFGTGHASILTFMKVMPKRLKIDRQLVIPIVESTDHREVVSTIIEMGRSRGIETVAEGVETYEHIEILRDLGCDMLQGYVLAKPMSGQDFVTFAQEKRWLDSARSRRLIA
jgi:diguanylate cyclase (GGDEF)-like protein